VNSHEEITLKIITSWLNDLSRLVRHGEEKPTRDQMAVYATMLAKDLPSGAFTEDSLHHVAQDMTWWPEFSSLRRTLVGWWNDHRPMKAPAITDQSASRTPLGYWDQRWLDYYNRRRIELLSNQRGLENLQSLVRGKSPLAWKIIEGDPPLMQPTSEQMASLRLTIETSAGPMARAMPRPVRPPVAISPEQLASERQASVDRLREAAARNVR
jgi:hypothetical protein